MGWLVDRARLNKTRFRLMKAEKTSDYKVLDGGIVEHMHTRF